MPFIQVYMTLMREFQRDANDVSDKIEGRFLEYLVWVLIHNLTFHPPSSC